MKKKTCTCGEPVYAKINGRKLCRDCFLKELKDERIQMADTIKQHKTYILK